MNKNVKKKELENKLNAMHYVKSMEMKNIKNYTLNKLQNNVKKIKKIFEQLPK